MTDLLEALRARRIENFTATAGVLAQSAVVTLVLSLIALTLFFAGFGQFFGPINDVLISITFFLLMPAVIVVARLASQLVGVWLQVLSWLALAGLIVAAVGQLALVVGLITLQTSFVTFGLGMVPFLLWIAALSAVTLMRPAPAIVSRATAWWGTAFIIVTAVALVAVPFVPMAILAALALPIVVALGAWMYTLGRDLRGRGADSGRP